MKNIKKLILLAIFFLFTLASSGVLAQSEEATPEAFPTVDPEIKEKVEERIQKILATEPGDKRAFVGEIIDINSILELKAKDGEQQVKFNEATTILDLERKEIEATDLEIGTYVIAMGRLDSLNVLEASRIVTIEEPEPLGLSIVYGEVSDLSSDGEKILTVRHLKKDEVFEIEATSKTQINQKVNENIEKVEFEKIETGTRLIAIGTFDKDAKFMSAKLIRLLPATGE